MSHMLRQKEGGAILNLEKKTDKVIPTKPKIRNQYMGAHGSACRQR